jgi:hypothetical protein
MLVKYGMGEKAKGLEDIRVSRVGDAQRVVKIKSFRQ